MSDKLAALLALAEKATPDDDYWLDDLFADQWRPHFEEYLCACSPEVVAALVKVAMAADWMRGKREHAWQVGDYDIARRALDAALTGGEHD